MSRWIMLSAATSVLALSVPTSAQNSSKQAVVDAQEQPITKSLNNSVAADAGTTDAINQAKQKQYDLDRAAYRAEVVARREKIMLDAAAYARQQAAYADAMAAWRLQSDACKRGSQKACNAPTPVPADFY